MLLAKGTWIGQRNSRGIIGTDMNVWISALHLECIDSIKTIGKIHSTQLKLGQDSAEFLNSPSEKGIS